MSSDHLQIPDVQANDDQKEVPINAGTNLLDRAMNGEASITITAADQFTTTETRENGFIEMIGTPGDTTVDMPDTNKRRLTLLNSTDGVMTIQNSVGGGSGLPILQIGDIQEFVYDGVDFVVLFKKGLRSRWFDANDMFVPNNTPAAAAVTTFNTAGRAEFRTIDFDSGVSVNDEDAMFNTVLPREWDLGTVAAEIYYSHNGTQTGGLDGVVFGLSGVAVSPAGSIDIVFGTEVDAASDQAAGDTLHAVSLTAITIGGTPAINDLTTFQVERKTTDGADDLDIDARLHGVLLFWLEG